MVLTYHAWGSGELVSRAFIALAAVADARLGGALAFAALLGLILCAISGAFSLAFSSVLGAPKMIVAAALVAGVLLAPVDVLVLEQSATANLVWPGLIYEIPTERVVSGVPAGAALPAAAASALGSELTNLVETSFGAVDREEKISAAGLWLRTRALRAMAAGKGGFNDASLPTDFRYFLENCIFFDSLAGRVDKRELLNGQVRDQLGNTSGGLTTVHQGEEGGGAIGPLSCARAWSGNTAGGYGTQTPGLDRRLLVEGHHRRFRACQSLRGLSLVMTAVDRSVDRSGAADPEGIGADCGTGLFANAASFFGFEDSVADAFADIVASELVTDYTHLLSGRGPETVAFTKFAAQRQRDSSYVVAGELAAGALPVLRGLLEAVLIVLLPVLLVVGLIFFEQLGMYLKNGMVMLVWLHLWPPVMAVINLTGQWVHAAALGEHAVLSGGEFTVAGIGALVEEIDTQLALSRYFLVLTPMLAYALVKSGEIGGAMLAGRLLQPGESAAVGVSASSALNNWSADQVSMAPRTMAGAHMAQITDSFGGVRTSYSDLSTVAMPVNEPGFLHAQHARTVTEAVRKRSEQATVELREAGERMVHSVESAYTETFGTQGRKVLETMRARGVGDRESYRALTGTTEAVRSAEQSARSIGEQDAFEGSVSLKLGTGVDWGLEIGGQMSDEARSTINSAYQKSMQNQSEETRSAVRELGSALESSDIASVSASGMISESSSKDAAMRDAGRHEESYLRSEQLSKRFARASEAAKQTADSLVRDMLRDPRAEELLGSFHNFYNRDGMSFDVAWEEAQRVSGHRMNMNDLADRLMERHSVYTQEDGESLQSAEVPGPETVLADYAAAHHRARAGVGKEPEIPGMLGETRTRLDEIRVDMEKIGIDADIGRSAATDAPDDLPKIKKPMSQRALGNVLGQFGIDLQKNSDIGFEKMNSGSDKEPHGERNEE